MIKSKLLAQYDGDEHQLFKELHKGQFDWKDLDGKTIIIKHYSSKEGTIVHGTDIETNEVYVFYVQIGNLPPNMIKI